jgi:hypothetical protein
MTTTPRKKKKTITRIESAKEEWPWEEAISKESTKIGVKKKSIKVTKTKGNTTKSKPIAKKDNLIEKNEKKQLDKAISLSLLTQKIEEQGGNVNDDDEILVLNDVSSSLKLENAPTTIEQELFKLRTQLGKLSAQEAEIQAKKIKIIKEIHNKSKKSKVTIENNFINLMNQESNNVDNVLNYLFPNLYKEEEGEEEENTNELLNDNSLFSSLCTLWNLTKQQGDFNDISNNNTFSEEYHAKLDIIKENVFINDKDNKGKDNGEEYKINTANEIDENNNNDQIMYNNVLSQFLLYMEGNLLTKSQINYKLPQPPPSSSPLSSSSSSSSSSIDSKLKSYIDKLLLRNFSLIIKQLKNIHTKNDSTNPNNIVIILKLFLSSLTEVLDYFHLIINNTNNTLDNHIITDEIMNSFISLNSDANSKNFQKEIMSMLELLLSNISTSITSNSNLMSTINQPNLSNYNNSINNQINNNAINNQINNNDNDNNFNLSIPSSPLFLNQNLIPSIRSPQKRFLNCEEVGNTIVEEVINYKVDDDENVDEDDYNNNGILSYNPIDNNIRYNDINNIIILDNDDDNNNNDKTKRYNNNDKNDNSNNSDDEINYNEIFSSRIEPDFNKMKIATLRRIAISDQVGLVNIKTKTKPSLIRILKAAWVRMNNDMNNERDYINIDDNCNIEVINMDITNSIVKNITSSSLSSSTMSYSINNQSNDQSLRQSETNNDNNNLDNIILNYCKSQSDILEKILTFTPLDLDDLINRMSQHSPPIKIMKTKLLKLLDNNGIFIKMNKLKKK